MQTVLTIAGFDPSSGAGVTADLMVFAAHGLFGTSAITALTVQSTVGVRASHAVDAEIVAATLACLEDDLPVAGVKIGMLGTAAMVDVVAEFVGALRASGRKVPVVLDPVLRSSSGRELLDAAGVEALKRRLLPGVDWVTPNVEELAALTGRAIANREDVEAGAGLLQEASGSRINVLAKGGHLDAPDDFLLTADGERHWLAGVRVETRSTHGTGCALSSSLVSRLVLGDAAYAAAAAAKRYVAEALRTATPMGQGRGPMNHLWPLRKA